MSGRLGADPLFQGLARPPMIAGVSYMFFILNAMTCMIMFINTHNIAAFALGIVIHGFGYLLCMKEPRAVELWMLRMKYRFLSWNSLIPTAESRKIYHGTTSYDVF